VILEMCCIRICVDLIFIRVGPLFSVLYVDLKCPLSGKEVLCNKRIRAFLSRDGF